MASKMFCPSCGREVRCRRVVKTPAPRYCGERRRRVVVNVCGDCGASYQAPRVFVNNVLAARGV